MCEADRSRVEEWREDRQQGWREYVQRMGLGEYQREKQILTIRGRAMLSQLWFREEGITECSKQQQEDNQHRGRTATESSSTEQGMKRGGRLNQELSKERERGEKQYLDLWIRWQKKKKERQTALGKNQAQIRRKEKQYKEQRIRDWKIWEAAEEELWALNRVRTWIEEERGEQIRQRLRGINTGRSQEEQRAIRDLQRSISWLMEEHSQGQGSPKGLNDGENMGLARLVANQLREVELLEVEEYRLQKQKEGQWVPVGPTAKRMSVEDRGREAVDLTHQYLALESSTAEAGHLKAERGRDKEWDH